MDQNGVFANLIKQLTKLPGVGQKTAQRHAFAILKMFPQEAREIGQAIIDIKERLIFCSKCRNISEVELCLICSDPRRDRTKILVVEEPSTVYAIEKTGEYRGLYHVLLGVISPLDGVSPEDIHIKELIDRLADHEVKEVIVATSPNMDGETTALYLSKTIRPLGVKVTRIALGIPVGIDIEYADEVSLVRSIEGRREL
ncbi:MAG: recombination protein RecR [Nitrospirae bacterium]|nr:recombination protein RecR [Nitrospirota bacterium]MBI3605717.1 recombination protein RecR [Nitrospirota bacterium]